MGIAGIVGENDGRPGFLDFRTERGIQGDPVDVTAPWRTLHGGQPSVSVRLQSSASVLLHGSLRAARYAASKVFRSGPNFDRTASEIKALNFLGGTFRLSRA